NPAILRLFRRYRVRTGPRPSESSDRRPRRAVGPIPRRRRCASQANRRRIGEDASVYGSRSRTDAVPRAELRGDPAKDHRASAQATPLARARRAALNDGSPRPLSPSLERRPGPLHPRLLQAPLLNPPGRAHRWGLIFTIYYSTEEGEAMARPLRLEFAGAIH